MASIRKIVRNCFLAALMLNGIGVVSPRAQAPAPEQPAPEVPPPPAPKKQARDESKPEQYGPGRQLAHQSNEAAGEEKDEMIEVKESASVKLIARLQGLNL